MQMAGHAFSIVLWLNRKEASPQQIAEDFGRDGCCAASLCRMTRP
jgi:hypothetical protein